MKIILRSTCLLLIFFLFFIVGLVGLVSADNDLYSFNQSNYYGKWGNLESPKSEYSIWGYKNTNYTFITDCKNNTLNINENPEIVFYWSCNEKGNGFDPSYYTRIPINETNNDPKLWNCSNKWSENGTYYVSVAMYQNKSFVNISYWVPIEIREKTRVEVKDFFMMREEKGSDATFKSKLYRNGTKYCGYVENDYSFSVNLNAISHSIEDNRTINETTTVVNWGDNKSDDSILNHFSNESVFSANDGNTVYINWSENFTHEWSKTNEYNISATYFYWDPLSGNETKWCCTNNCSENYSINCSDNCSQNCSILIIRDPKNFFTLTNPVKNPITGCFISLVISLIQPFSNLQNIGLFLVTIGLIILFFVFMKYDSVPVKIALFGKKPFDLRSVDFFIGIITFVAGMYLYFVFSRCPWDIPIINSLSLLYDAYFSVLYYDYYTIPKIIHTTDTNAIPYLSILLGLLVVLASSMILYWIGIPFLKRESEIIKLLRVKRIPVLRSGIFRMSLLFKELSLQMKKSIKKINLPNGKVTRLKVNPEKKKGFE
jgi:hypothetical protein